jgi:hypothetical protein
LRANRLGTTVTLVNWRAAAAGVIVKLCLVSLLGAKSAPGLYTASTV